MENPVSKFEVIVLGIIFDPSRKKILIAKRESNPDTKELDWYFPGGRLQSGEGMDQTLKKKLKLKTGYDVKNIGAFFSTTQEENPDMISVTFLTEVFEGEESPGDDVLEIKWVSPTEIEEHFKIPMHKKLKEFLLELV